MSSARARETTSEIWESAIRGEDTGPRSEAGARRHGAGSPDTLLTMHVVVGLLCLAGTLVLLAEFFVVFLLPRRVKRDPRIARGLLRSLWVPWRAIGRRLPKVASDTMLGVFGP